MDLVAFTRALIDIPSPSGEEAAVGRYLADRLAEWGFLVTTQPVDGDRFNVIARVGDPRVVLSTHIDTVPPFIASREDDARIHGRGACDAKGLVAAMVFAARRLRDEGRRDLGLLFVVGEEDGSQGAQAANTLPNRCRYVINGEPTESHQATGGKGVLRVTLEAAGRTAHAAYPELGESAIEKLLDVLHDVRRATWPASERLGPTTYNIGVIGGGIKANVVPDAASAEVMFRTVTDPSDVLARVIALAGDRVRVTPGLRMRPIEMRTVPEIDRPETVVRFATDIPWLDRWGEPLLFGPGSIHVAHTAHEFIDKAEQAAAVETYAAMVRVLLARAQGEAS
jgi:acetylornithine deacetylase